MKRFLILALLVLFLISGVAVAGRVEKTELMDETFNASTTAANSTAANTGGADKVSFFVNYAETEVGGGVSARIELEISYDGTNFYNARFFDYEGGTTLQESETISADDGYFFWIDEATCPPYARVVVNAYNTDADDLLDVEAYSITQE
jgi:hypothetical protein